jgi:predicted branched-subunit amino acid permease
MLRQDPLMFFGVISLVVGLGSGYLVYTHPEGLNPEWPMGMALLAVSVFVFAGLHMIAIGLGYPRVSGIIIQVILLAFFGVFNWAAFFTTHYQCVETVSFLGFQIFSHVPSEESCRNGMRVIVGTIDVIIVLGLVAFAKQRWQRSRNEPPANP